MNNSRIVKPNWNDNRFLGRVVKRMAVLVAVLVIAFGAYYYWDRYVHLGDMSPAELGITHLEQVMQENPDDPNVRLSLAQSYIENQDYPNAILQAQNVLTAYPDNPGALLLLGIAYSLSDQAQAAIQPLESFTDQRRAAQDPQMDKVLETSLFYLGKNYLILNQPDKAIAALKEALGIDHTDADAIYLLGSAYAQIGEHQSALEAFQTSVRFVPNFTEAYQEMEQSYLALGMADYLPYAQGMKAYSSKDFAQARQLLEQAALNLPDFAPLYLGLAMTYEELSELTLAQTSIQRALELDPSDFAANAVQVRLQSRD
jgi:tetratricopeptide (TPR) repeat protein